MCGSLHQWWMLNQISKCWCWSYVDSSWFLFTACTYVVVLYQYFHMHFSNTEIAVILHIMLLSISDLFRFKTHCHNSDKERSRQACLIIYRYCFCLFTVRHILIHESGPSFLILHFSLRYSSPPFCTFDLLWSGIFKCCTFSRWKKHLQMSCTILLK